MFKFCLEYNCLFVYLRRDNPTEDSEEEGGDWSLPTPGMSSKVSTEAESLGACTRGAERRTNKNWFPKRSEARLNEIWATY